MRQAFHFDDVRWPSEHRCLRQRLWAETWLGLFSGLRWRAVVRIAHNGRGESKAI